MYRDSLRGPQVIFVGTCRLPIFGSVPLLLNAGLLLLLDSSGKIVQTKLETYGFLSDSPEQEYTLDDAIDRLSKAILMKRSTNIEPEDERLILFPNLLFGLDMTMLCSGLNN